MPNSSDRIAFTSLDRRWQTLLACISDSEKNDEEHGLVGSAFIEFGGGSLPKLSPEEFFEKTLNGPSQKQMFPER